MPSSLHSRLLRYHLVVLLIGMGLAALFSWRVVEEMYLETQRENLLAQAELIAATLREQALPSAAAEPYSQASNVMPGIHTRVIGEQGAVIIGLSDRAPDALLPVPPADAPGLVTSQELLERPEIAQALQGRAATAVRRAAAGSGRRVVYAAAPIMGQGGQVNGLAYVAMPLPPGGLPPGSLLALAVAGLTAIGLAVVAASLLARRIARPVEDVAAAAVAVGGGDLEPRVPVGQGIRELDSLGRAFNQMTASLRQADQAKTAFVADVTHELRTPLTVIKGTIETLEDGAWDDIAGRGPLLAAMQRETDRLIRLVQGLLVLVRADAGTLRLNPGPVDLVDLARTRCEQLALLARPRAVVFNVAAPEDEAVCVLGDRDRLSQVLDNLLDNALRYSPDGSTVSVSFVRRAAVWECSVSDEGSGIPEQHRPFVFERFYRADPSRTRQSGGSGLGLAIARSLVQAQSGTIAVECPAGGGTILRFSLPAVDDCHATD